MQIIRLTYFAVAAVLESSNNPKCKLLYVVVYDYMTRRLHGNKTEYPFAGRKH